MAKAEQLCTFSLEGDLFGIPVSEVQEVLRFQDMAAIPLAPPVVRGMLNLRGQIVVAIDLRRRLGLKEASEENLPMNVVVRAGDGVVSLLVDKIGDVIEVDPSTFEPPPDTAGGSLREIILGVHKLNGRLLHVLDVEKARDIGDRAGPSKPSTG